MPKEETKEISHHFLQLLERNNGAIMATERLLMMEYAAVIDILPPRRPATTGAEVAVAVNTQIIAACANISLKGLSNRNTSALPTYCMARRIK